MPTHLGVLNGVVIETSSSSLDLPLALDDSTTGEENSLRWCKSFVSQLPLRPTPMLFPPIGVEYCCWYLKRTKTFLIEAQMWVNINSITYDLSKDLSKSIRLMGVWSGTFMKWTFFPKAVFFRLVIGIADTGVEY